MQIIAGSKRGAKLAMVADLSVRPTAHRTRESLFNILQGGRVSVDLQDAVILDLFAWDLVPWPVKPCHVARPKPLSLKNIMMRLPSFAKMSGVSDLRIGSN